MTQHLTQHRGGRGDGSARRRRAGLVLGGLAALILLVIVALVAFLLGRGDTSAPGAPGIPSGPATAAPAPSDGGWDVAAETALATRPMLELPESAALPHAMTAETAGPPLRLPSAGMSAGRLVPGGFPGTPEGALAQLAALTEVGLAGGDPQGWAQAYESVALPGAPQVESTRLYRDLVYVRSGVGLPTTGAVPDLVFTYKVTSGQIKGTTDDGRYAVVCVLGELVTGANGQSLSTGAGDCQALRYVQGEWRISPGAAAATAPLAWPGTAEAVRAGYRAVTR